MGARGLTEGGGAEVDCAWLPVYLQISQPGLLESSQVPCVLWLFALMALGSQ